MIRELGLGLVLWSAALGCGASTGNQEPAPATGQSAEPDDGSESSPGASDVGSESACQDGESRAADDGCNHCSCKGGKWACTKMACIDDDGKSGGATEKEPEDGEVAEFAHRAIHLLRVWTGDADLKLLKIERSSTQVVAGTNIRLLLQVETGGEKKALDVVLYRDLKDNVSLKRVHGMRGAPLSDPSCDEKKTRLGPDGCNQCDCRGRCTKMACSPGRWD